MIWKKIRKFFRRTKDQKMLSSRDVGNGMYEINGTFIKASSHAKAFEKYRVMYS